MSESRKPAEWIVISDEFLEYLDKPVLWAWGDWYIACNGAGKYMLIVSSGVEYGPFATFEQAKQHAENVRGD